MHKDLQERYSHATQEMHHLQMRFESTSAKLAKAAEFERQVKQIRQQYDALKRKTSKERMLFTSAIEQSVVLYATYFASLQDANKIIHNLLCESSKLHMNRYGIMRMFTTDGFRGTALPVPTAEVRSKPDISSSEFGEFGRHDVACAVRIYLEAFGPFESPDDCDRVCAWRPDETVLAYLSRMSGYVMANMLPESMAELEHRGFGR